MDRVTLDSGGNLYETLVMGGALGYGQVLELMRSGNNWTFVDLHDFYRWRQRWNPGWRSRAGLQPSVIT